MDRGCCTPQYYAIKTFLVSFLPFLFLLWVEFERKRFSVTSCRLCMWRGNQNKEWTKQLLTYHFSKFLPSFGFIQCQSWFLGKKSHFLAFSIFKKIYKINKTKYQKSGRSKVHLGTCEHVYNCMECSMKRSL